MKIFKHELVFWVVSGEGGQVRKIRFTVGRLLAIGCATAASVMFLLLIASDYARMQWNGLKQTLHLESISEERDHLISSQKELQVRLEELLASRNETDDFRREIKQRLVELSKVLRSVPSPELNSAREFKKRGSAKEGGMGGAEIPVKNFNGMARPNTKLFEEQEVLSDEMIITLEQLLTLMRITPLGHPVKGEMSSGFGFRWSPFEEGMLSRHEGIDFATKRGTPIVATADGIVTDISSNNTYGLKVDLTHHPELFTRYGHMARTVVKRGQILRRGDVIGYVGSTGRSTGPHLHYEVRFRGKAINPEIYLGLHERLIKTLG